MNIYDLIKETSTALSINKARSGLTVLGIVIGIASVIAMVSIGQGAQQTIQSSIEGLGSNLLTIMPGGSTQNNRGFVSAGRGSGQTLKLSDADALSQLDGVAAVSPELQRRFQIVSSLGNNTNSTVIGAIPAYQEVRNMTVDNGVFITASQNQSMAKVAVLGATAATDLFGENDPIGKTARINGTDFKVIGVLQSKGGSGFFSQDDMVIIPLLTMQKILSGSDYLSTISVSVVNKDEMSQVQETITQELYSRHHVSEADADFSIMSQADILSALNQITGTFTIFLASIAGISLVVGGIGIMNMMLTTVTERTREIGLRKSVGAKKKDISFQFLTEAVMLTFIGGLIGIILGYLISVLISKIAGINTAVAASSVLLAFGVSAAIGIIFGYYPARRASNLNPIEALRYE